MRCNHRNDEVTNSWQPHCPLSLKYMEDAWIGTVVATRFEPQRGSMIVIGGEQELKMTKQKP